MDDELNVLEIVEAYIHKNGYDGLYTGSPFPDGCECYKGDLMRECEGKKAMRCFPGYKCVDSITGEEYIGEKEDE